MSVDILQIEKFVLIFIRISTAFAVFPIFKNVAFPSMAKAGLAAILALMLTPSVFFTTPTATGTAIDFFVLAVREAACGILLGFAGQMLFFSIEIAAQMIGFQAGFSMVSSIDPNTESESTVLIQAYNLLAMMVFITIDGHHMILKAIADSLQIIPLGQLTIDNRFAEWGVQTTGKLMSDGILLAAPLMITLLFTDIGLAILSRVAPTMNVFVLGFPLKIGVTLMLGAMTLGTVATIFSHQSAEFMAGFKNFEKLLAP